MLSQTEEELKLIASTIQTNFMFSNLAQKHKEMVYRVMKLRQVKENELVIKEGDPGDEMYVVNRYGIRNKYLYLHTVCVFYVNINF